MTLPSWARPATAWSRNALLLRGQLAGSSGRRAEGPAERRQHLAGVARVEQIDRGRVLALDEADFQLAHEPADGQPEVVADQDEALHPPAVALPQGLHQLGVLLPSRLACSHCSNWSSTISTFLPGGEALAPAQGGQRLHQAQVRPAGRDSASAGR